MGKEFIEKPEPVFKCTAILCDNCGKDIKKKENNNLVTITTDFGYGSPRDEDNRKFYLCENCYNKVLNFLQLSHEDGEKI